MKTTQPITKKQVSELKPNPFVPQFSYPRFKNGTMPKKAKPYAFKREWSFDGTHSFELPDGTIEQRPGMYVVKMRRK